MTDMEGNMADNICNAVGDYHKQLKPGLVGTSDNVYTTDIGRLLFQSSNNVLMAIGGTVSSTSLFVGWISKVETNPTTGGSTNLLYYTKFSPVDEVSITYSTLYGGGHPATTDIGKYIGLSTTATIAGAVLDMQNVGNAPGTTNGRFLRITGFSTNRRKITGFAAVNSSCIAW